jgi:hypothetical protein
MRVWNWEFVDLQTSVYKTNLTFGKDFMNQHLDKIDNDIADKNLLKHPFYLAWTRGKLSKEALAD